MIFKKFSKMFLSTLLGISLLFTTGCQKSEPTGRNTDTVTQAPTQAATSQSQDTQLTDSKESKDSQESATSIQSQVNQDESKTRTVSTVMGDVEVPVNPQRVVVNWYIGYAYALDLNVVGYYCWAHEAMPFYDKMMSTTSIETWDQEAVMSLEPDLIITYSEDDYKTFSSIAPVIVLPEDMSATERVLFLGEATGKSKEAQASVDTFETKLAATKETLQGEDFKDKSFSINEDWGSASYGVYFETGSRGGTLVYDYLNLKKPEKLEQLIEESGEGRGALSYEVAAEYFGDYMIWFRPYNAVEDVPSEYETSPIWESLPAVQAGQVITIPGNMSGLFYYDDVLSLTSQLDYIIGKLNEIVK